MNTSSLDRLRSVLGDRYVIERELGSGGMATVYLARDSKHHRDVAIKVLRSEFAALLGADRFLNEIDVIAHLQHPHILPLFDSGEADGVLYYVMPRVDGESLRERLRRERLLPVVEALQITRDVAGALDYAHRHKVIHRDIKPGNILLQDGQALVADFGIALAVSAAGGDRITATGLSLGTPEYMSPEQAAGDRDPDARSDIYSLAAVLYEMLTGQPPHTGSTSQTILAKALTEPPRPVRQLRDTVPLHVDAALHKALAKLPADRFVSAAAFSAALAEPTAVRTSELAPVASREMRRPRQVGWQVAAITATIAAIASAALWGSRRSHVTDVTQVRRWEIVLSDSAPLAFVGVASLGIGRPSLALSPDGSRLVYVARRATSTQLYLRELDKLASTPLAGTEGAYQPFFSPDGRWVAFFAGTELKKVSVPGGQVITLARVNDAFGGAWTPEGRLLIAADQGSQPGWVPAAGGALQPIARPQEPRWRFPQLLPDGDWVLHGGSFGALYLSSLESGRAFVITSDGVTPRDSTDMSKLLYGKNPMYIATGHILYLSSGDSVLMALPFDAARRRVLGSPVPVLGGVRQEAQVGGAQLAVAGDGTLLYAPGANAELSVLVWVDPRGRTDTLPFPRAGYGGFDLSPDGRQALIWVVSAAGRGELRVLDLDRVSQTRIATRGYPFNPRWWPDGKHVVFAELTYAGGVGSPVVRQSLTTASRRDTLVIATFTAVPSPDGHRLAVLGWRGEPGVWLVPADGRAGQPVQLVAENVSFPSFSPDGRWFAYTEFAEAEVYVISTEQPQERHRISIAGGEEALWSSRGDRIIYRNRQQWFAVDVSTQNGFRASRPRLLFEGPYLNVPGWSHGLSPDGRRHLLLVGPQEETTDRLVVVTNWFAELRRLAPPSGK